MNVNDVTVDLKVKTRTALGTTEGMLVRRDHLDARRTDAEGTVLGYVP